MIDHWSPDVKIESETGALPASPEDVLELAASWPEADREGLMTYQWVATGEA